MPIECAFAHHWSCRAPRWANSRSSPCPISAGAGEFAHPTADAGDARGRRSNLTFAERAGDLLLQRLEQIFQRGALARLDEHFGRHARHQLEMIQAADLVGRDVDANHVIGLVRLLLLLGQVGADQGHVAGAVRRGALVAGNDAVGSLGAECDLVDVLRRDLGLDHELVRLRHDLHDRLAIADDAAHRVHAELMHDAALRRPDIHALELILRRRHTLLELGDLALGFAQVLEHLGAEILIELQDLQLGLAVLGARAGDRRDELAALALEPRLVALQRHEALNADEVLLVELGHADQLLADELDLVFLGLLLRHQSGDLFVGLGDALAQLRALAGAATLARIEQLLLAGDGDGDAAFGPRVGHALLGEGSGLGFLAFGQQPRLARRQFIELRTHHAERRTRDRIVEPDHGLALLDHAAFLHDDLPDDAARRVLHLLDVRFDHDGAGADYGAGDVRAGGPAADDSHQQRHRREADEIELADRLSRIDGARVHDSLLPASATTRRLRSWPAAAAAAAGCGARASSLASTWSRGPKACWVPFISTSALSHPIRDDCRCAMMMTMAPRFLASAMAFCRAASPSPSRFELGSSSTMRKGSP